MAATLEEIVKDVSVDQLLLLSRDYLSRNNFSSALILLNSILSKEPGNAVAKELVDQIFYGAAYPKRVLIEPTNVCHMGCPGCGGRGGELGFMPVDGFKNLLSEIGPHLNSIWLHNRGDSFHHPEIYRMLEIIGGYPHIRTTIHTHGCFEDFDAEAIVRSKGLHELVFSIDGASQETYSQYRRNGDIQLCFNNIRKMREAKTRLNSPYPVVTWKYIVMKTNEHEMKRASIIATQIGCDKFEFSPFAVSWLNVEQKKEGFESYVDKFLPTDPQYRNFNTKILDREQKKTADASHCFSVNTDKTLIRWNGDVEPCCACVNQASHVMGNVFETHSFQQIWNSQKFRAFRKQAVVNCRTLKSCERCHII